MIKTDKFVAFRRGGMRAALAIVGISALSALVPGQAAAQQSLGTAISNQLVSPAGLPCPNISPASGSQLQTICGNMPGGAGAGASSPTAGSPTSASDLGGQDPENRTRRRLEELRKVEQNADGSTRPMTGRSGAAGNDMNFTAGAFSGFATFNYENTDRKVTDLEPGYNSNRYGVTAGLDRRFGNLVVGGAFDYSHTGGDFDNAGGDFGTDSYGGLAYASFTPIENAFIDVSGGYARKNYDITRAFTLTATNGFTTSGREKGETDGNEWRFGATTGYDFNFQRFTVGPRVGVNYVHTNVDAFTESGTSGLEVAFDKRNITSLTSSVGVRGSAAFSTSFGVLVPQATADYIHEFRNDQDTLTGHLVQDLAATPLVFNNDKPDRNYFGLGAGLVAVLPEGFSSFVNYRAIVGDELRTVHTVSLGLRKEF